MATKIVTLLMDKGNLGDHAIAGAIGKFMQHTKQRHLAGVKQATQLRIGTVERNAESQSPLLGVQIETDSPRVVSYLHTEFRSRESAGLKIAAYDPGVKLAAWGRVEPDGAFVS